MHSEELHRDTLMSDDEDLAGETPTFRPPPPPPEVEERRKAIAVAYGDPAKVAAEKKKMADQLAKLRALKEKRVGPAPVRGPIFDALDDIIDRDYVAPAPAPVKLKSDLPARTSAGRPLSSPRSPGAKPSAKYPSSAPSAPSAASASHASSPRSHASSPRSSGVKPPPNARPTSPRSSPRSDRGANSSGGREHRPGRGSGGGTAAAATAATAAPAPAVPPYSPVGGGAPATVAPSSAMAAAAAVPLSVASSRPKRRDGSGVVWEPGPGASVDLLDFAACFQVSAGAK